MDLLDPFSCQLYHIAFDRLKSLTPLLCPGILSINISLKFHCVYFILNFTITNTVISKTSYRFMRYRGNKKGSRQHRCNRIRTKNNRSPPKWGGVLLRQISAKDPDSHNWFVSCNDLLHKYSLPNIYTVRAEFGSEPQVKQHVEVSIVRYTKESWLSVAEDRKSLGFLNMESCNVGNIHPCWSTVDNTVIDVRRAY